MQIEIYLHQLTEIMYWLVCEIARTYKAVKICNMDIFILFSFGYKIQCLGSDF